MLHNVFTAIKIYLDSIKRLQTLISVLKCVLECLDNFRLNHFNPSGTINYPYYMGSLLLYLTSYKFEYMITA